MTDQKLIKNYDTCLAHLANTAISLYLQNLPKLVDKLTVEVYGTVWEKYLEVLKGAGVSFEVFQSKLGYSRLKLNIFDR